jgi:uncharacterized protein (TIGR02452 family)
MHLERKRTAEHAHETLQILQDGVYLAPSGHRVDLREGIAQAKAGTETYPPEREVPRAIPARHATTITITNESTLAAAHRLATAGHGPVALNFASARHPGGGFLSGAQAQEESLARTSALYACLHGNPMYAWHETNRDPFYTDYAIYSPDVPIFREESGALLEEPYRCAFITCPAVNAKVALERNPNCGLAIRAAMAKRIERVLAIAAAHHHTHIVLGAWGCGVFGNDPHDIAALFRAALGGPFRGVFAGVTFAVLDSSPARSTLSPFEQAFGNQRGDIPDI